MSSQESTILIMRQHELLQQYEKFVDGQRQLINGLWEHIYMLHKVSLSLDKSDLEKVKILASMTYASFQAGRSGEAIERSNEDESENVDHSLELVKRLIQDLENNGNGTQG
jgi:hypothetical protein